MLKILIPIMATILWCKCDHPDTVNYNIHKIKPGHHYHDPYYHHILYGGGLLYYLTFLAIKVKVLFILGVIFTFFLFFGKLFALIKFGEYMKVHHHHEPEKIYVQTPSHHYEADFKSGIIADPVFSGDHPPGVVANDKFYKTRPLLPIPVRSRYTTLPARYQPGGRSLDVKDSGNNKFSVFDGIKYSNVSRNNT